jgi:hypothetical protein
MLGEFNFSVFKGDANSSDYRALNVMIINELRNRRKKRRKPNVSV